MIRTEPLDNGLVILTDDRCNFGTDAVLLSRFAAVHGTDRVCDLGTGSGILPLLWYAAGLTPAVDAVELSAHAASLARRAVEQNGLSDRITVHEQDWCTLTLPAGVYDAVVCNPPYFAVGSGKVCPDADRCLARHETATTLSDVVTAAHRLLKFGGHLYLCHRPERLTDLLAALRGVGLEPKRLQLVQARADSAPFLLLCEAVKGGKPSLRVLPTQLLEK